MELLNRFTLNDFQTGFRYPDGVVSILSTKSQLVNNLVYYDKKSLNKISEVLNKKEVDNIQDFLRITQLQGPITLQELYIPDNQIGDEGAIAIGKGLQTNTSLQELYIYDNQIGDDVKQDLKDIGQQLSKNISI